MQVAYGLLQVQQQPLAPAAPITSYAAVSLSNVIATSCQYEALKYVAFPLQTLGKCAKMIPVMIWGTLISRKAYSAKDYMAALLVTAGCTGFLLSRGAEPKTSRESSLAGVLLMLTYLTFDGFTSTFQVSDFQTRGCLHFTPDRNVHKQCTCFATVLRSCAQLLHLCGDAITSTCCGACLKVLCTALAEMVGCHDEHLLWQEVRQVDISDMPMSEQR